MNKKRKAVLIMATFFSVGAASLVSAGPAAAQAPECEWSQCGGSGAGAVSQTPTPPTSLMPDDEHDHDDCDVSPWHCHD
ncbi:hypothetical protein ABZ470_09580 [Streptosporangium sp. NPDC020072]|uniref:hypothetical protein n=1 Tax=Streptosporangium sp. NPDC020072 TaxID=3154788 RepID=UPI00343D7169